MNVSEVIEFIRNELSMITGTPVNHIQTSDLFDTYRINSIQAMQLLDELEEHFHCKVSPLWFWEYPTIDAFAARVVEGHRQ